MLAITSGKGDNLNITTQWGTIKLKKSDNRPMFGQKAVFFLPEHGDFGCCCASCSLYRIAENYNKKGYTVVDFLQAENN